MKKPVLVVMAAGMGSRYGGLKQMDPVDEKGRVILDYSVYDAAAAGFEEVIFVIKPEMKESFEETVGKRIQGKIGYSFAFQTTDDIPEGFVVPEGRVKPWGTGHAVYCVKDKVDTPFALINADDYYGGSSFKLICDSLKNSDDMCMVGFELGNTLTDNGTVSRGVCDVQDGFLKGIEEHTALDKNSGIPLDTIVSMNMWGLTPEVFGYVESDFIGFLNTMENPMKSEFYIPTVIDNMIHRHNYNIKVLECAEKWYGVTYKEDKATVAAAMKEKTERGLYNGI